MFAQSRTAVAAAVVILLSACGGGGGTQTSTPPAPAPAAQAPTALALDAGGNIQLVDGLKLRVVTPAGVVSTRTVTPAGADSVIAGTPGAYGVRLGAPGSLGAIDALAVGMDGNVYVMSENAVLRIGA